jgi:biopolymer transport protein ExbD
MIPMIDVIFFLLVFFILFTTFKTNPAGINLELPRSATAQGHDITHIEIEINEAGSTFYNGRLVSESMLRDYISPILKASPRMPVIIKADRRAKYEVVYHVMDLVSQAGGSSIHLAAKAETR